jgi:tetratricopeptide (TPR) repeat protein
MRIRATVLLILSLAASPATAQERAPQDDRFQAALGLARVKRDAGDFAAARRSFEEARTLRSFDAAQLAEYFWVVVAANDSAAAFAAGREALVADPANHKVRDRVLTEANALGRETDVVAIAEQGMNLEKTTALWPRRIGESYLRQGQPALAANAFLQATKLSGATDKDRESLAVSLEAAGRYRESADAWRGFAAPTSTLSAGVARSRLRAFALSNSPEASSELEAWLAGNPGDVEIRALAVEAWTRLNQPEKALATAAPLTGDDWLRRKAGIARGAKLHGQAIEFLDKLGRRMTSGDRLALADLLILERQFGRAATVLTELSAGPLKCDDRVLELADRIPERAGTQSLIQALGQPPCQKTKWLARAIERSVAASDHKTALKLIERLPSSATGSNESLRLKGQLQLWTGDVAQAIPTLEAVVGQFPADASARESLVDAYRAQHRSDEAWRAAGPLVAGDSLSESRRLSLAALALEVDRPVAAMSLVGSPTSDAGRELLGRALLMNGRHADAKSTLAALAPERMTPPAALALVDAIAAIEGTEAARAAAARFDGRTVEWADFLARRVVLEGSAGQKDAASVLRAVLTGLNPHLAAITDIESELAAKRPRRALELIALLPNDPQSERVADLEAIARAASGDTAGALALLETLSRLRPESAVLKMRLADVRYQMAPQPENLAAMVAIADANPGNTTLAIVAGRALASAGQHREAVALLDRAAQPASLPLEGRTLLAELRQTLEGTAVEKSSSSVAIDPDSFEAWRLKFDTAAQKGSAEVTVVLEQFESAAAAQPSLAIGVADHLSAFVRPGNDPLASRVLVLLQNVKATTPAELFARESARARVFAAIERWDASLEAADAALAVDQNAPAGLKLRAEVLSWSGRHADAVKAYDAYLARAPQDIEAKRQQARVLGWAGRFNEARQRYARLVREHPDNARIAAEAAAKTAFYDGRWSAAAAAYQHWLALEPENGEARFEHAESLRAAGVGSAAQAELRRLDSTGRHRLASAALDRERVDSAASIGVIADAHGSKGYDNQRLLDIKQSGAAFRTSLGRPESALRVAVTRVAMSADDLELRGNRVGLEGGFNVAPRLRLAGSAAAWDLGISGGPAVDASVTSVWRASDRWDLAAGFERASVFENLDTVVGRLHGAGPFAAVAFESPVMTFTFRASAQELSDDNGRQRATLTWTRALPSHLKHVRMIGWAEALAYRVSSLEYFSPSRQIRVDGGLQYTHEFSTPRFRNDRQQTLSFGYLVGLDDDGETYHHPMMNLAIEFARGLSIDARANLIRSDVYRETSVFVGMTIKPRARIQ